MANTASAKKRIRSSEKKRLRNRQFRASARTYVKQSRTLIESGELDKAEDKVRLASIFLDKSARKGIIHRRNAARRKSRLYRQLAVARKASKS